VDGKRWRYDNHDIHLLEFYSNPNPKWPSSGKRGRKTFDAFTERSLRFQIPPAQCGRGVSLTYNLHFSQNIHVIECDYPGFSLMAYTSVLCSVILVSSVTNVFNFTKNIYATKQPKQHYYVFTANEP